MKQVALRTAEALVLPTAGFVVALALAPGRAELWGHLYLVVVLAIALAAVVALIRAAEPPPSESQFDAALLRPARIHERLPELTRLEREVELAAASSFDLHFRLRPVLREIAGGLLAARRGIDLDLQPARALDALGAETYELVRPDVGPPDDRHGPGMAPERLQRVISSLESL